MSNKAVSDIKQFMRQMDMTDSEQIERLLQAYTVSVKEYNGICEQLRTFIKNKMVEEMERFLNELDPPLQEQYRELRDPTVKEFLETAELYGLEIPLAEDVFDELGTAVLDNVGLRPLIIRYRQIARSSNIQKKLEVIRQILAQNPDDQVEWERNLVSLEEEWKEQLKEKAKQDILSGDYQDLKSVQEIMQTEPWKSPVAENVLQKIQQVLEDERRRRNQQLCEQLIRAADETMEKEGNLDKVASMFGRIHGLLSSDAALQISPELGERLVQLEEVWKKARKEADETLQFNNLFQSLEQKMSSNAPLEEVENIFYDMQRLRRAIPEITQRKVESYRSAKLAAAKRKKLVIHGVGILVVLLLVGVAVIVFRSFTRSSSLKEYCARLRTVVNDTGTLSDEGYEILKEMEAQVPDLRYDPAVTSLVEELNAKHAGEEKQRARFKELQMTLNTQLENYAANASDIQNVLKELQKHAMKEHQEELEALVAKHDEQRAKYIKAQDAAYRKLCGDAGDAYQAMKRLLSENRINEARDSLGVLEERLRDAEQLADVSFDAKNSLADLVKLYGGAVDVLNQSVIDSDLDGRMKPQEEWLQGVRRLVLDQNTAMLDVEWKKSPAMKDAFESLEKEIEKGSVSYRNRFDAMKKVWQEVTDGVNSLGDLIKEEDKGFAEALRKSNLIEVKQALSEFREKYLYYYRRETLGTLMGDIEQSLNGKLFEYDRDLIEKNKRFQESFAVMANGLREFILKKRDDCVANPVYMIGFINANTQCSMDVYMQDNSGANNGGYNSQGVKFEANRNNRDLYSLTNVLGLNEQATVRVEPENCKLTIDGNVVKISERLSYPTFKNQMSLAKNPYRRQGPLGDWLFSLGDNAFDFSQFDSYMKLDKLMRNMFVSKSDGVRCVQFFLELANVALTSNSCFGEGGEFEMTETVNFKKKLESLLGYLPKAQHWLSVSWRYPDETKAFYTALLNYAGQENPMPFSNDARRLWTESANASKTLTPVGILYDEIDKNGQVGKKICLFQALAPNTEGHFYIADHGNKKSILIARYKVNEIGQWSWEQVDALKSLPRDFMYVVHMKK